ncbi:hypothetical protein RJ641_024058 [Dillenia turbinata]|uniref:Jacalin-type lectin domain-containing protein n=1 Tax=Dillenia turbinata TaxID=194707 RepID=A0AAN8UAM5_9MAGN
MEEGRIVGFKGRSGWYLDAIGFRVSHVQSKKLYQKVQQKFLKIADFASKSLAPKDTHDQDSPRFYA